jgi:hypothetical protein
MCSDNAVFLRAVALLAAPQAISPDLIRRCLQFSLKFMEALEYHDSRQSCAFLKDAESVDVALWSAMCSPSASATSGGADPLSVKELEKCEQLVSVAGLLSDLGRPDATCRNVWIVKPSHLSKGEGIRCFDDIMQAVNYAKELEFDVVAQKYIERPLLIRARKVWFIVCGRAGYLTDFD